MYWFIIVFATQQFRTVRSFQPIAAISFVNAYKKLKTPQIDQINYLFQLWRLLWVKSYANEQKYKHWRQKRFALEKIHAWKMNQ